jgi:hypothetical protein
MVRAPGVLVSHCTTANCSSTLEHCASNMETMPSSSLRATERQTNHTRIGRPGRAGGAKLRQSKLLRGGWVSYSNISDPAAAADAAILLGAGQQSKSRGKACLFGAAGRSLVAGKRVTWREIRLAEQGAGPRKQLAETTGSLDRAATPVSPTHGSSSSSRRNQQLDPGWHWVHVGSLASAGKGERNDHEIRFRPSWPLARPYITQVLPRRRFSHETPCVGCNRQPPCDRE